MRRLVAELGDAVALSDRGLRHLSRLRTAEQDLMREHRRLPTRAEIIERLREELGGERVDAAAELLLDLLAARGKLPGVNERRVATAAR